VSSTPLSRVSVRSPRENAAPVVTQPGWQADLSRSRALLRAFRLEQSDPHHFYSVLAADSVPQLEQYTSLTGKTVVDIGGGAGYYREEFSRSGARYYVVDPDLSELSALGPPSAGTVRGDGTRLPLKTASVDVAFSSNALEHVAQPEAFAEEMLRVTRPGGIVFLSYTVWLSPNGGHETGPLHLVLGGRRAADRYARRHGRRPKNDFGHTMFALSAARMLRWSDRAVSDGRAELLARAPRYHPSWARWVIEVPILRELASWNCLLVLRRTSS
jgi:SAM-dependent methyltransferase